MDYEHTSIEERAVIIAKYGIKRLPGTNEYHHTLFSVTHGCGHTTTVGSLNRSVNQFVRDSCTEDFEQCLECYGRDQWL